MTIIIEYPEDDSENGTPIQKFYKNAKIFITGGTGFVGRLLIEKLLRACPDIEKIYILVREKSGKSLETRLDELFKDIVFDPLRKLHPDFQNKIHPIFGDCSLLNLGISKQDEKLLIEEITIVFHCAATVSFDEHIKTATEINVRGTREVLQLCQQMKNLCSVTHVSTAYSNCPQKIIKEKFYKPPMTPEGIIDLVYNADDKKLTEMTPNLIGKYPNTYAYTKAISEDLIKQYSKCLPLSVFRPAIIVSTLQEPISGWINNLYGPQGISTAAMTGLLRTLYCDENADSNIVPVDMCVNALIAIPWKCSHFIEELNNNLKQTDSNYEVPIFNYETNSTNPLNWREFRFLTHLYGQYYMPSKVLSVYFFHLISNYYVYKMTVLFWHMYPAIVGDIILYCIRKKPIFIKGYKKIHKFSKVISYFCTQRWEFECKNTRELIETMSAKDKEMFFCDIAQLDWHKFFTTYLLGCRLYLLKDPIDNLDTAIYNYKNRTVPLTYLATTLLILLLGLLSCGFYKLVLFIFGITTNWLT